MKIQKSWDLMKKNLRLSIFKIEMNSFIIFK